MVLLGNQSFVWRKNMTLKFVEDGTENWSPFNSHPCIRGCTLSIFPSRMQYRVTMQVLPFQRLHVLAGNHVHRRNCLKKRD